MKTKMIDAEYAPYWVQPALSYIGAWNVMAKLSEKYNLLVYQGTEGEARVIAAALNLLAKEREQNDAKSSAM